MPGELGELLGVNPAALEDRYRGRELYRGARVEAPLAVRLDGVGWGRRLQGYAWPRDRRVHLWLCRGVVEAVRLLGADMAYVTSDEASLLWVSRSPPYGGRVEKLDSVAASTVSSTVSLGLGRILPLDGRVVKLYTPGDAADYVRFRARVGLNNYLASLYHKLKPGEKETPPLSEIVEALREIGVDVSRLPRWALLGSCIAPLPSTRLVETGAGEGVVVERRRLVVVEGYRLCLELLGSSGQRGSGEGSLP